VIGKGCKGRGRLGACVGFRARAVFIGAFLAGVSIKTSELGADRHPAAF
jgi:hypothetical protein